MNIVIEKINQLNQKAFQHIYKDLSISEKLAEEAIILATANQDSRGIAWSLLNVGLIEIEKGNIESALEKLKQSKRIFLQIEYDFRGIICSSNSLGLAYIRQGKMEKAFNYLHKSLEKSREYELKDLEFTAVNYLGILQFRSERYSQALRFFENAYKLGTASNKTSILNNLGCTHRVLHNNKKALEYFETALLQAEKEQRKEAQTAILEEMGMTYGQMGNDQKGILFLQKALSSCAPDHRHRLSISINMGELYLKLQNYSSAEEVLHKAEKLITDSNATNHRKLYLFLSELYERNGDYKKAISYYKEYHRYSDELKCLKLEEKFWLMETESLQKMNQRISTISVMGRKLTAFLERKELLKTLVLSLSSLFSIDICIIGELSSDLERLETRIFNLENNESRSEQFKIDEPQNIMTWVSVHKSGLMLNDIHKEFSSYFSSLDHSFMPVPVSSGLCLPYEISENETSENRGFVAIYSKKVNAFNDEDWHFLEMLTSYAAIALNNCRQTETIKAYNTELVELNKFDTLMKIYNRRHLLFMLENSWEWSCRNGLYLHVMLIDIDNFKVINDTWGHEAGDLCLIEIGRIFKECLQRSIDGYGRYGGEEFIVYLQDMDPEEACYMAEKIRARIAGRKFDITKKELHLTASIGLYSMIPQKGKKKDIHSLIQEADKNMYNSKKTGRNRVSSSQA